MTDLRHYHLHKHFIEFIKGVLFPTSSGSTGKQVCDKLKLSFSIFTFLFLLIAGGTSFGVAEESSRMLSVITKDEGGVTHLYLQNDRDVPVTTTFEMKLDNLKSSADFPYTTVVPPKKTVEAFKLSPVHDKIPWHFGYTYHSLMGTPAAVHNDSFVYELPFAPHTHHCVTEGYHGKFSHYGPDEYAIDWKMPEGTEVRAARAGLVVKSEGGFSEGGIDQKFRDKCNEIMILHCDGTMAIYAHLKQYGNRAKVGDRVGIGALIGFSGNTGYSSGPHLHFEVCKTKDGREHLSLPVIFNTANKGVTIPMLGQTYEAAPLSPPVLAKSLEELGTNAALTRVAIPAAMISASR